ncbi:phosphotransferase family protein [Nocardioides gilvus]|uniref:phosphotransferase family protein n=1 Tax=Nocardioides gilvus TaxID=1735589 RepID=UPI001EF56DD5|nr:phosphotransferase [Nocardioides gilvus]
MTWDPLPGGWSGESFLAEIDGVRSVVRICATPSARGERAADVDGALMRLLRGLVPVPEVLEVRAARDGNPPLLITRYVPGVRADNLVRGQDAGVLAPLGAQLGRIAGTLAGIPTVGSGHFVDAGLRIEPFAPEADDLLSHVMSRLPSLRDFGPARTEGLLEVARRAQDELDSVPRTCLVHGDLNPKNVVVDPDTGSVVAVVDWEHAHAGSPYADLGSLLRFDRHSAWEEAVLSGWVAVRGGTAEQARDLARCADLFALLDLASRPAGNLVVDLAEVFLREIARETDWNAAP